jgi:hypothetical protein
MGEFFDLHLLRDPEIIGATIGGIATIMGALITVWVAISLKTGKFFWWQKRKPDPRLIKQTVLRYLRAAKEAIKGLGQDRQRILTDAADCDLRNLRQVEALCKRMHIYLREHKNRPKLKDAITDLNGCREDIKDVPSEQWRNRDKKAAERAFVCMLDKLKVQLQDLDNNFVDPICSGMGLKTLMPIDELIVRVRNDLRQGRMSDVKVDQEKLTELVRAASHDPANKKWMQDTDDIELLIMDLQLEFSFSGTERT